MRDPSSPSSFSLWLEEALHGWILPVGALLLVGVGAGLYTFGSLGEVAAALAMAAVAALAATLVSIRPALAAATPPVARAAVGALAVVSGLLAFVPVVVTVAPGEPLAEGELTRPGDAVPLPDGVAGRLRLLLHAPLPAGGVPSADFRLSAGAGAIEGHVERAVSYTRVGRGSRAAVMRDHADVWVRGAAAAGASITLERLSGQVAGALHVAAYRDRLPPWLLLVLGLVTLVAAAVVEARFSLQNVTVLSAMAASYGLLLATNATPASAVGTSVGGVLLGVMLGALGGGLVAWLVKRFVPPAEAPARSRGRMRPA